MAANLRACSRARSSNTRPNVVIEAGQDAAPDELGAEAAGDVGAVRGDESEPEGEVGIRHAIDGALGLLGIVEGWDRTWPLTRATDAGYICGHSSSARSKPISISLNGDHGPAAQLSTNASSLGGSLTSKPAPMRHSRTRSRN